MSSAPSGRSGILGLIGNTPMIELKGFDTGLCELFIKLENQNPGGSIKDRIGLSMIEDAEHAHRIRPGDTLVEATAGNTGLGLALVAAQKGYRLRLVIPDKMSLEKISHLRALGAEIVMTRSDVCKGHRDYYQDLAQRLALESGAYYVNQFENPANPLAHEVGTAPEIWSALGGRVDAIVCGVGSGGTLTGISRYFERTAPHVEMVLADPEGSILAEYVRTGKVVAPGGSWLIEGIGEDFIPSIADLSRVRHAFTVSDEESFLTARALLRTSGILAGSSSGTLVAAALRYCRAQTSAKRVVTFVCDSGNKYLSKMFSDYWMRDQGFLGRSGPGGLRELISRSSDAGAVIAVAPDDSLLVAYGRLRLYDVSQLPVLDDGRIVGMLDESDLLIAATRDADAFKEPVRTVMTRKLVTLQVTASIEQLLPVFDLGMVAIVVDGERFLGLVTRIDLLNYLRRRVA